MQSRRYLDADKVTPMSTRMDAFMWSGVPIHFIGIGGCGMSGLALMLRARGAIVSGSDQAESDLTQSLKSHGIAVSIGTDAESLPQGTLLVVASAAIKSDHAELARAHSLGIEAITYAECLGRAQLGRTGVSIAGTHGKSTTTALLGYILIEAGLDPSVIVGATCKQIGGGSRTGAEQIPVGTRQGDPGIFVAESCEFNRSFHHHHPTIALINNVEEDHLDVYSGLDEIVKAFREFAGVLPSAEAGGRLLIAHEGAHRRAVASGIAARVFTFGWSPSADYRVEYDPTTRATSVWHDGEEVLSWTARLKGDHNALNSAAAGIIALWLGAQRGAVEEAIAGFKGIDRRMQFLGECTMTSGAKVQVVDDYGHHPTECEKTLAALRASESPPRIICVFQPHQHSRTRFLLEQFAQSFSKADVVIVAPIYFVRDSEIEKTLVSAADLAGRLVARGTEARAIDGFDEIVEHLEREARDGDLVVVMGAGPIWQVAHDLVARSEARRCGAASLPSNAAASPDPA